MKNTEFIVLGLAGVALWLIVKGGAKPAGAAPVASAPYARTEEVFDYDRGAFDNGWRYFTDGGASYAIDPSGAYYRDGQRVWVPM